jgi:septal ring factor EnvC (AmiA/AmiB activator)
MVARIVLIISIFCNCLSSFAQTRAEIELKKEATQAEIESAKKILDQTSAKKKDKLNNLLVLVRKIQLHDQLIGHLNDEISLLDEEIENTNSYIHDLEENIEKIKAEYSALIYQAFKNRKDIDRLVFIFSAKNFNQAYKRVKYLQQYSEYRKAQVKEIREERERQLLMVEQLRQLMDEKQSIIDEKAKESIAMDKERRNKESMVRVLGKEEAKLRSEIREKERISKQLEAAMKRIIDEEARKVAATPMLTPEEKLISDDFRKNKGRLPWPTEKGTITGTFGLNDHPVLKGVKVNNNGIDITTTSGSQARALFNGEVKMVASIPGANKVVIIRHGNFMTMYSNLVDVYVKVGDKVTTKQAIGLIFTGNGNDEQTVLHLEIWEEKTVQDPALWLSRY